MLWALGDLQLKLKQNLPFPLTFLISNPFILRLDTIKDYLYHHNHRPCSVARLRYGLLLLVRVPSVLVLATRQARPCRLRLFRGWLYQHIPACRRPCWASHQHTIQVAILIIPQLCYPQQHQEHRDYGRRMIRAMTCREHISTLTYCQHSLHLWIVAMGASLVLPSA
jgi:hypothetical protein